MIVVTEKENTDESESDPPACKVLTDWVLITLARFASVFDSLFLYLILEQSTFQCPNSLQKAYWFFFRSPKPGLDFDLPWSPLPFLPKLLPFTVNTSVESLFEEDCLFFFYTS